MPKTIRRRVVACTWASECCHFDADLSEAGIADEEHDKLADLEGEVVEKSIEVSRRRTGVDPNEEDIRVALEDLDQAVSALVAYRYMLQTA